MNADTQVVPGGGIRRGRATWYCYLMYGFFMYLLTIQGNIIPFLRSELHLGYGAVSLHSSAFAAGVFATGVFGDWLIRRYGRRWVLWLGALGMSAGAALLCLASAAWASIVLGLGIALLYPLTISFAIGAAGARSDTASARAALAGSLALLATPALLGGFADKVGLHLAHLIVPGLVVAALICFVVGQVLPSQAKLHQSG